MKEKDRKKRLSTCEKRGYHNWIDVSGVKVKRACAECPKTYDGNRNPPVK